MNSSDFDHRRMERAADKASDLRRLVEDLETFSYGISHDLRAPLRAITGFSTVLIEEHSSTLNDEGRDYLNRIKTASRRMDQLIQGVLNFSQSSKGELMLVLVHPTAVIKEIIMIYPNLDPAFLTVKISPILPPVLANEAALIQCISNILSNAAKFGATGIKPEVIVSSSLNEGVVRILFKDNGIGIAPENHTRIFEMLNRVDQSREGNGIGLSVVKRTMERMGGRVGLESELGKGTTVWMDFPSSAPRGN
jgi:signal transduction histidine kinase